MPPHCDSMDGPVVTAAREALEEEDFEAVAPFVAADYEDDLRDAFDFATKAWTQGVEARIVAERYFFETAVRLHRAGEGASYTGLKPAGLDVGPVIPLAVAALQQGSTGDLSAFLTDELQGRMASRFEDVLAHQEKAAESVEEARAYVRLELGFQVWSHHIHELLMS